MSIYSQLGQVVGTAAACLTIGFGAGNRRAALRPGFEVTFPPREPNGPWNVCLLRVTLLGAERVRWVRVEIPEGVVRAEWDPEGFHKPLPEERMARHRRRLREREWAEWDVLIEGAGGVEVPVVVYCRRGLWRYRVIADVCLPYQIAIR